MSTTNEWTNAGQQLNKFNVQSLYLNSKAMKCLIMAQLIIGKSHVQQIICHLSSSRLSLSPSLSDSYSLALFSVPCSCYQQCKFMSVVPSLNTSNILSAQNNLIIIDKDNSISKSHDDNTWYEIFLPSTPLAELRRSPSVPNSESKHSISFLHIHLIHFP